VVENDKMRVVSYMVKIERELQLAAFERSKAQIERHLKNTFTVNTQKRN
jgi:hypothetical protein